MASSNPRNLRNSRDANSNTIFLDGLRRYAAKGVLRFHTPGHRGGRWLPDSFAAALGASLGQIDVSDVLEGDGSVSTWTDALEIAQQNTAELFGASASRYLVNGTSGGIHAAVMALASGGTAVCNRAAHLSVVAASVLGRCSVVNLAPDFDDEWDIPGPPPVKQVIDVVRGAHPDLYIETYPNYYGVAPRLDQVVEGIGDVAVLADEAHGSHFRFSPGAPVPALESGACVTVQSFHKTLGALTQASVLHLGADYEHLLPRLDRSLFLLQTTSASPILLSSLEAATAQAWGSAQEDWRRAERLAARLRAESQDKVDCGVLTDESVWSRWHATLDPTRVVIRVADIGWSGVEAASRLRSDYDIQVEMANRRCVVLLVSPGNTESEIDRVIQALELLKASGGQRPLPRTLTPPPMPPQIIPPWEAVDASIAWVPLSESRDRVCAEMVCPYPPGIPVVLPGEKLTSEVLDFLIQIREEGIEVKGAARSDLSEIGVVC